MSATPLALDTLEGLGLLETPAPTPERRTRLREGIRSAVTLASAAGHTHCALFIGTTGNGFTSPAPDGHVHQVRELEILVAAGHTHEIARRCLLAHDRHTGRHVIPKR